MVLRAVPRPSPQRAIQLASAGTMVEFATFPSSCHVALAVSQTRHIMQLGTSVCIISLQLQLYEALLP